MPAGAFRFNLQLPTGLEMFAMGFLTVNPSFVRCITRAEIGRHQLTGGHKEQN